MSSPYAIAGVAVFVALSLSGAPARAAACKAPETGSKDVPMFSPPLGKRVMGQGRLQFYSAPNAACVMAGVFVVPKDELVAYGETRDGWTSVMYTNPKTGADVEGWVRSGRLNTTGTEGPAQ